MQDLLTPKIERALRWAAECHDGQVRKGSKLPYFVHVVGVAMILQRLGYGEDVVAAGLLHDVVEDTPATIDDVRERFGPVVAELVGHGSEVKKDSEGKKRPWIDRKRDHLAALSDAPAEARAVVLADKLHNLASIRADLDEGRPVWTLFNADRASVLWYYHASIETLGREEGGDPRLSALAKACRAALSEVESFG